MRSKAMGFSIFTLFLFTLTSVYAPFCAGEVLFEDDFEKKAIDKGKWVPTGTWSVDGGNLSLTVEKSGLLSKMTLLTLSSMLTFT